jgi:hypothetical protein
MASNERCFPLKYQIERPPVNHLPYLDALSIISIQT